VESSRVRKISEMTLDDLDTPLAEAETLSCLTMCQTLSVNELFSSRIRGSVPTPVSSSTTPKHNHSSIDIIKKYRSMPHEQTDLEWLDFAVFRFFVKLFKTTNVTMIRQYTRNSWLWVVKC